ncbi:ABC transporter ATP-binding protein [Acuticoccus sp.]|uniref:ABC transporter ATP-binding protein n=1 Tax=Acuticoccus sp. TaxID=1904378 RepID=UPI003B51E5BE
MSIATRHDGATPPRDVGGPRQPLLIVEDLVKHFPLRGGRRVRAVDGVSFEVAKGETLAIVGESGCGKSTAARLMLGLVPRTGGRLILDGELVDTRALPWKSVRRDVQMVFQDSYASLNPRLTVADTIAFGPVVHGTPRSEARARARDLLARCGLDPDRFANRYPHELSGGQRQRVNIARALALEPRLVVFDEPTSALDKSVEAQVLNLLVELKADFGLTYVFISHDLNVVRYVADRVLVMYLGRVAEVGPVEDVFADPRHPYTRALLGAMPTHDPDVRTTEAPLAGDPPNPVDPPSGCRFRTRCAFVEDVCATESPALLGDAGHLDACLMNQPNSSHSRSPTR